MTSNIKLAYKELLSKTKDVTVLETAEGIIHWDMETMMPPRSGRATKPATLIAKPYSSQNGHRPTNRKTTQTTYNQAPSTKR